MCTQWKGGFKRMWTKPEYTEMRFGFEVTMYIATR
jgi:coenzyme PQQ precursor peptide PqqA